MWALAQALDSAVGDYPTAKVASFFSGAIDGFVRAGEALGKVEQKARCDSDTDVQYFWRKNREKGAQRFDWDDIKSVPQVALWEVLA